MAYNQGMRIAFISLMLCWTLVAEAVLFDATGDPAYNTNAPTDALSGSGWQFEGHFGGFLGTAVDSHYFLTARHIGGDTNTPFVFEGTNYYPVTYYDDPAPGSDLRLWQVSGRLPTYAPFYTGTDEVGATIMVIGRGTQRGSELSNEGITNGWLWGASDSVTRWGLNQAASIQFVNGAPYLYATFTHGAGSNECHLSVGDSGGASFMQENGVWKLAGIHYSVDGNFNTTNIGKGFSASLYDAYGLYIGEESNWKLVTNHVATGFYSSRVSAHYDWITNVIPDFDSNANGLPDWWEARYSGSIHGLAATNDADNDGLSNYAEWVARTDPTNAASVLRIDAMQTSNSTATLTFQGWSDRLYGIDARPDLLAPGGWTRVTTPLFPGTDGPTSWADTNVLTAPTSQFYRLSVELQ